MLPRNSDTDESIIYYSFNTLLVFCYLVSSVLGATVAPPTANDDYPIGPEKLASMVKNQNISALQKYGGVSRSQFVCLQF